MYVKIHFFLARFARKCVFFYAIAAMLGVKTYKYFPVYRYSNLSIHNTHADIDYRLTLLFEYQLCLFLRVQSLRF